MRLLQIDPFLTKMGQYGLLGLLVVLFAYVIYYLFNRNKELTEAYIKQALDTAKQDHDDNRSLIEKLQKEAIETAEKNAKIELERTRERTEFIQIIVKFEKLVEENTEVIKANTEVFKAIKDKL